MSTLADLDARRVFLPFESARGGSGATGVEVVHLTVRDDEGATGTGFTYALTGGGGAIARLVEDDMWGVVQNTDIQLWERHHSTLRGHFTRFGEGLALAAVSALDIAVWDLRARRVHQPLHRLLGSYRDSVPAYGSGRATHQMSVDELVEGAQSYLDEGYRAVKLRAGAREVRADVSRIAAVRDAVDDDTVLMVDCNERLDLPRARWLATALADLDVLWLEEPLPASDVRAHTSLAASAPMGLAVGEHLHGRAAFAQYVAADAATVLMPDAPLCGGITETMRIATLADAFGLSLTPHFLPELHIHVVCAAQTGFYAEHFPLIDGLLAETLGVDDDGMMRPPDRPGHGMLWDEDALVRHVVD